MHGESSGCPTPGSTGDRVGELLRQARLVDDLLDRVASVRRTLPTTGDLAGWRGPAADMLAAAVDEQSAHLGREVYRLDTVRTGLRGEAAIAEAGALRLGGMP